MGKSACEITCSTTRNRTDNYTGKGTATYPNGDVFKGDFLDGVSTILNQ